MKIFSIPEFETYYHEWKRTQMQPRFHDTLPIERFKLTKKKIVKKRKTEVVPGKFDIPTNVTVDPLVTKDAFDTNKFNDLVVAYFRSVHGSQSFRRISSEGRYREGMPLKNGKKFTGYLKGLNNGIEDLQGTVNGRMIGVETKSTKDTMKPEQKERMNALRADGGIYIIGRDFEQIQRDYYEALEALQS